MLREEQKTETRLKIISNTVTLVEEKGFVGLSTKDIANASNVSQGTIFLHFGTKNNLLYTLLESNLELLINNLDKRCMASLIQDNFFKEFVSVIVQHENLLSRVYKDYAYLPEKHQKQIDDLETLIKNKFFDNLKTNRSTSISIIDSFILIDAFVSQMKSYLLEKSVYSITNSIIRQRRGRLMKLYRMLFQS